MESNTQLPNRLNELIEHEMTVRDIHSLVVMCELQRVHEYLDIKADELEVQVLQHYNPKKLNKVYFIGSEKLTDKFPILVPIAHTFDTVDLNKPRKLFFIDMVDSPILTDEFYNFAFKAMIQGHVVLVKSRTKSCPLSKGPNHVLYKEKGIAIYHVGVTADD